MVPCDLMNEIAENRFSETVTFSANTNDVILICLPQSSNFKNHFVLPRAHGSSDIKRERERERERVNSLSLNSGSCYWVVTIQLGLSF